MTERRMAGDEGVEAENTSLASAMVTAFADS